MSKITVIEGGYGVGKSTRLQGIRDMLVEQGQMAIFINASEPIAKWFSDVSLPLKRLDLKIKYLLNTLPRHYHLLIDNADSIPDTSNNPKLNLISTLLNQADDAYITCQHYNKLPPSLQAKFKSLKVKREFMGSGGGGFDITYIVLAVVIIVVASMGQHNLIFVAAAMRYMFQGLRTGGRV